MAENAHLPAYEHRFPAASHLVLPSPATFFNSLLSAPLDPTRSLPRLAVPGGELEYCRFDGDPARPTIVLLHEGLGCLALWRDFPERLAAATGLNAFAYSRFGYGGSSPAALPWPIDYMQREGLHGLPAVLDAAGIRECVLLGHSDGASIALVHAGGVQDPRVRGVIVLAPHVFVEPATGLPAIREARRQYAAGDLRARLARYHGANVDCAFRGWCDSWLHPAFVTWNIEAYLGGIEVPVLQIQGEGDQYGSIEQLRRIERHVRGPVMTHVLAECRHAPQFDQPERTLSLVTDFMARLAEARRG